MAAVSPGKTIHVTRSLGRQDLVMALSFRRCLRQTVEGVQQARSNGAYTVGITDTFVSPLARFANECFLTSVEAPFSNSYAAPDELYSRAFHDLRPLPPLSHSVLLKKADKEQRNGYRWFPA